MDLNVWFWAHPCDVGVVYGEMMSQLPGGFSWHSSWSLTPPLSPDYWHTWVNTSSPIHCHRLAWHPVFLSVGPCAFLTAFTLHVAQSAHVHHLCTGNLVYTKLLSQLDPEIFWWQLVHILFKTSTYTNDKNNSRNPKRRDKCRMSPQTSMFVFLSCFSCKDFLIC